MKKIAILMTMIISLVGCSNLQEKPKMYHKMLVVP